MRNGCLGFGKQDGYFLFMFVFLLAREESEFKLEKEMTKGITPDGFSKAYERYMSGECTIMDAARELHVAPDTFMKWAHERIKIENRVRENKRKKFRRGLHGPSSHIRLKNEKLDL